MPLILIIVAALAAFLFWVSRKPDTFVVRRARVFNASAETLHGMINSYYEMQKWSAWARMDDAMQTTHSGAASGVGAKMAWSGNNKVGVGNMEITASQPHSMVKMALNFEKPFKANNVATFTITPQGSGCEVDWQMTGAADFMTKLAHTFMNIDKMVGKDFEQSFDNMQAVLDANKA